MDAPDLAVHDSMTARLAYRDEIEKRVGDFVGAHDLEPLMALLLAAEVLRDLVGLTAPEIDDLRHRGVV